MLIHRYRTVYNSVLSIVLISIWPTILGLISILYCVLSIPPFSSNAEPSKPS